MKITPLHRITSIVLAILMLFTSVGVSADLHFCKGELQSFSFIGEAESCHTINKSCPHHANMVVIDKSEKECCSNKSIEVDELDTDFNISSDTVVSNAEVEIVTPFVCKFFLFSTLSVEQSISIDLNDQLPSWDIYVLLERFLI